MYRHARSMCDQRRGSSDKKKRLSLSFVVLSSRVSRRSICIVDPGRASSLSAEKRPGSEAENLFSFAVEAKVTQFPKACLYQKLNPKTPIPKRTNTMSAQDESTAQPTSPTLCKMGCGFFVSISCCLAACGLIVVESPNRVSDRTVFSSPAVSQLHVRGPGNSGAFRGLPRVSTSRRWPQQCERHQ